MRGASVPHASLLATTIAGASTASPTVAAVPMHTQSAGSGRTARTTRTNVAVRSSDTTGLKRSGSAIVLPSVAHRTPSTPYAAAATPVIAPSTACVVDTG